jgi:beta-lactamase regulating signal transducer with metallopeptidase domain
MNSFIETLNHWGDHFLNFAWPMLWQSSLLIAIVFVLDFALRRKIRAAIRYALWLMVLVKLILPPSLALPTSVTWWLPTSPQPPTKPQTTEFAVNYGDQSALTVPLQSQPAPAPIQPKMSAAAWALAASGAVSAGLLAWLLFRWRQINQKVRRATASEELIPILHEARRLTHLRPGIRLKLTDDSMSPAVCGLFRPVILLPQPLVEKLSAGQLRAVLLHEAIHLRRGDVWVNCAQALLQIFYWWHPLLWLANARIRRVREEAVDDAVMLALRDEAEIYAPTLLEVARLAFNRPLASLGLVGILESRSALRQRIERLINFNAPRRAGLTVVSILGILAFSAVALPMGEAPENTNAEAVSLQKDDNVMAVTNSIDGKIQAGKLVQDGKLLYEMGKFEDAETNLNQALKLDPDNQAAFYYLSLVTQAKWSPNVGVGLPVPNNYATNRLGVLTPPRALFVGLPVPNPYVTNTDVHTNPGREMIYRKLNSLRLESVSWPDGKPLTEVIGYLAEQSKLLDPDKKGISFLFNPNEAAKTNATGTAPETVDASAINVKLALNHVSFQLLLDAIVLVADRPIKYSVEDYGVVFSAKPPGPEPPILEMRVFRVDTNQFFAGMRGLPGLETNNVQAMVKSFFSAIGIDLTAPGRSIAFNGKLGLLMVTATASELDTIERVVQALNQTPPQIHIKARFIEVEQDNNPARGFDWYLGSFSNGSVVANGRGAPALAPPVSAANPLGSFPGNTTTSVIPASATDQQLASGLRNTVPAPATATGILSDTNFRVTLHALESRPRTTILAEPEAVTISGRQTQMRATVIQTVLTNINPLALKPPGVSSNDLFLTEQVECGPVFDVVPYVLSDGYTLYLTTTASVTEFLGYDKPTNSVTVFISGKKQTVPVPHPKFRTQKISTVANLWDNQTLVLGGPVTSVAQTNKDKVPLLGDSRLVGRLFRSQTEISMENHLMVFVTATIVDPAGNRVHSDDNLPFNPSTVPPQPKLSTPSP